MSGPGEGDAGSGPSGGAGTGPKPTHPPSRSEFWDVPAAGRKVADLSVDAVTVRSGPPGVLLRQLAAGIRAREAVNARRVPGLRKPTGWAYDALLRVI